jgi:hypothetical protein
MFKQSIKPSKNLMRDVNRLLKNNRTKNYGIKKLTNKLRLNNPKWNSNEITMGKVRKAKSIFNKNKKSHKKNHISKRTIPSIGLLKRVSKSLKGKHAKAALVLAVHPRKGLLSVVKLPNPPPSRFN